MVGFQSWLQGVLVIFSPSFIANHQPKQPAMSFENNNFDPSSINTIVIIMIIWLSDSMISTCGVVKNRCNCITTLNKLTQHHQKSMGLITIQCVVNGQDQGESYDSHDGAGKFGEPKGGWKFQL